MKTIKYKILGYKEVWNPETGEVEQQECLAGVECAYTEAAYQDALSKAYNGEVTVEEVPDPELTISEQIAALKAELSSTDYKIIKCSEAQLVGDIKPYDIVELHAERQALRDKINELESQLEGSDE